MVTSIKWCCKQKSGIKIESSNDNLVKSYLKMAENAIGTMNRERNLNLQFAVSACYYSMYYSLYVVLMKFGIKCEIHSCTLKFMKQFLRELYSVEEVKTINKACDIRETMQYYADKVVQKSDIDVIMLQAPLFLNKSKSILEKLNENDIKKIRNELEKICNNPTESVKKDT